MNEQFDFKKKYRNILLILMTGGILVSLAVILISKPGASRIWANVLLNNQYFIGLPGCSIFPCGSQGCSVRVAYTTAEIA